MNPTLYWIAIAVVTVIGSARLTRLAVYDDFPPIRWVRNVFLDAMEKGPRRSQWQLLALCGYCFSFWATLLVVVWGLLAHVYGHPPNDPTLAQTIWYILFGALAASYLAAAFVANDGDGSDD